MTDPIRRPLPSPTAPLRPNGVAPGTRPLGDTAPIAAPGDRLRVSGGPPPAATGGLNAEQRHSVPLSFVWTSASPVRGLGAAGYEASYPTRMTVLPPRAFYAVPPSYSFQFFTGGARPLDPAVRVLHVVASNHGRDLAALEPATLAARADRGSYYAEAARIAARAVAA